MKRYTSLFAESPCSTAPVSRRTPAGSNSFCSWHFQSALHDDRAVRPCVLGPPITLGSKLFTRAARALGETRISQRTPPRKFLVDTFDTIAKLSKAAGLAVFDP